jgi:hypothetical protein
MKLSSIGCGLVKQGLRGGVEGGRGRGRREFDIQGWWERVFIKSGEKGSSMSVRSV